ncbi:hypothetical protein M514_02720, partial [Trichuris suis]
MVDGCGDRGVPLSYLIIREKAVRLFNKMKQKALEEGDESLTQVEFSGSRGWFHRFLKRGHLRRLKLTGESASVDTEAASKFVEELKRLITEGGYSYKQMFNCDESALYWKRLASKTFISKKSKV